MIGMSPNRAGPGVTIEHMVDRREGKGSMYDCPSP